MTLSRASRQGQKPSDDSSPELETPLQDHTVPASFTTSTELVEHHASTKPPSIHSHSASTRRWHNVPPFVVTLVPAGARTEQAQNTSSSPTHTTGIRTAPEPPYHVLSTST